MKNKIYALILFLTMAPGNTAGASTSGAVTAAADNRNSYAADQLELEAAQEGAVFARSAPNVPASSAVRDGELSAPGAVGPVLDPRFLELGADIKKAAIADWDGRLKDNGGRPSLAPLAPIDPARDILLCIPGHGQNFQDMHALAKLEDTYQVVIAVVNDKLSMYENGRDLAGIMSQLMEYRRALGIANGVTVNSGLRLAAHSMGGGIAQLMLQELVDRNKLYYGTGSIFSKVIFIGMDSIWRGVDAPWLFHAPGIGELTKHSLMSLANRGDVMDRLQRVKMPANVTTHFVTVHHKLATSPEMRHFEPIANWYSNELGAGETEKLWKFLRNGETDFNKLDDFAMAGLIRKQGLQNLWRTLARDADYAAHKDEIKDAAVKARTMEEFAVGYDAALEKIVDTFNVPDHTAFMWQDPAFLPWIRNRLGN